MWFCHLLFTAAAAAAEGAGDGAVVRTMDSGRRRRGKRAARRRKQTPRRWYAKVQYQEQNIFQDEKGNNTEEGTTLGTKGRYLL